MILRFITPLLIIATGLLGGCSHPQLNGASAVLVPVTSELSLSEKSSGSNTEIGNKAEQFITDEFTRGAEHIEVLASGKGAGRTINFLQKKLVRYKPRISYRTGKSAKGLTRLTLRASRTEVLMPACTPLSSADIWSAPDGCFTDRARNKSLASPSSLVPVASELSKER